MAERGGGAVIIVSSIAALRGQTDVATYALSKAANTQLARNLAVEWGAKNVRVNSIGPGLLHTDFSKSIWEDEEKLAKSSAATPMRRMVEPEEIGGAAAFLASPVARFITGQMIIVDGGMIIQG